LLSLLLFGKKRSSLSGVFSGEKGATCLGGSARAETLGAMCVYVEERPLERCLALAFE